MKESLGKTELRTRFEQIWDVAIRERLEKGDLHIEADLQAVFRCELETSGLVQPKAEEPPYRYYHNLMLLKANKQQRYDLVIMKYPSPGKPRQHYPAIVAEFKMWGHHVKLMDDVKKLQKLWGEQYPMAPDGFLERPDAAYAMGIFLLKCRKSVLKLESDLREFEKECKAERPCLSHSFDRVIVPGAQANQILKLTTELAQFNRYEKKQEKMDWVHWNDNDRDDWPMQLWLVRVRISSQDHA